MLVGMLWIEAAFSYIPRSEGGHFLPLGEARDLLLAHGISFLAHKLEVRSLCTTQTISCLKRLFYMLILVTRYRFIFRAFDWES